METTGAAGTAAGPHGTEVPADAGGPAEGADARHAPGRLRLTGDAGMATAEYAIATVAAAGFAGLLILVLRSDEVREMLTSIVRGALSL